jgi:hypothetical protein
LIFRQFLFEYTFLFKNTLSIFLINLPVYPGPSRSRSSFGLSNNSGVKHRLELGGSLPTHPLAIKLPYFNIHSFQSRNKQAFTAFLKSPDPLFPPTAILISNCLEIK